MQATDRNTTRRGIITAAILVAALGVGIWAQRYLTDLSVPLDGKVGYLIAIVLFVWALVRNPVHVLTDTPRARTVPKIVSIVTPRWRRWLLVASGALFLVSLVFYGQSPGCSATFDYCFTPTNLTLWFLTLAAFLGATWDWRSTDPREVRERILGFRFTVTWVGIALLGIMAVAAWFLFYRLASVPAETTSDHAEKLYDVLSIVEGQRPIFLPNNTGREPLFFYWAAWLINTFNLRADHLAIKLAASLASMVTIPFVFLLGRELGGTSVGLLAAFFTACSKWFIAITRVGLRVPTSPMLATPALFFAFRGLRLNRRNDWLLAGLCTGLGLMTYTPSRMIPLLVMMLIGLRLVWDVVTMPGGVRAAWRYVRASAGQVNLPMTPHRSASLGIAATAPSVETTAPAQTWERPRFVPPTLTLAFWQNVLLMIAAAFVAFLPLLRFSVERRDLFWFRSLTRASTLETGQAFNPLARLLENLWNAALQFNYRGDVVWVNTVPWDPQLDVVSGTLFVFGFIYVILALFGVFHIGKRRFGIFTERRFTAAALLVALFMLLLPSILALAFPIENPSVFRAANAPPVVMVFVALPLVLIARQIRAALVNWGTVVAAVLVGAVLLAVLVLNHRTYFETYDFQLRRSAWNASEMAQVLGGFVDSEGDLDHAWIVAYPNWVDTRNVFLAMGAGKRNNYIPTERLQQVIPTQANDPAAKMYLLSQQDQNGLRILQTTFPQGQTSTYFSRTPGKDFVVFFVPMSPGPS